MDLQALNATEQHMDLLMSLVLAPQQHLVLKVCRGFLSINCLFTSRLLPGVSVQVYRTIATTGSPMTTFQVDDLPLYTFTFSTNTGNQTSYRVQLYTSPFLNPANHTLVISSIGDTSPEIFLDYIVYNPIPSLDLSTNTLTSTVTIVSSSATNDFATASSTNDRALLTAGSLAGGVIGGLVLDFVLGIILTFIMFRGKEKKRLSMKIHKVFGRPLCFNVLAY